MTEQKPMTSQSAGSPAGVPLLTRFVEIVYRYGLIIVFAAMLGFFAIAQPAFRTPANGLFILQSATLVTIVALGVTISMSVGGFDLSVGATLGTAVMVSSLAMIKFNLTGPTAILLGLGAGVLVGLFNSLLIVTCKIPDLVATLATMFLVGGATLILTNGQSVSEGMTINDRGEVAPGKVTELFDWIGGGSVLGIPASVVITAVVVLLAFVLMNQTRWGRALYAVGGNPVAANLVGLRVRRYRTLAYVLSGLLAALAGVLLLARSGRGDVAVGDAYLLQAVSAALVGFGVLGANRPNVLGTVVGAVFVAALINGLTMFNFPYYAQIFVQGLLLVSALVMTYTVAPLRFRR